MNKLPFELIKRKVLTKKQAQTSSEYGAIPEERSVETLLKTGIINIDKPQGPTSHQVADYIKRILKAKKAGHSGTLDPNVTGVLPTALEDSTKIVQVLLPAGKEYIAVAHFHKSVSEKDIRNEFNNYIGKIEQLPPVKSAVKRQLRERNIYYIEIMEITGQDVLFRVGCQAGTYIRKLIHDIGRNLGGAHMAELRRTKAGPFDESTIVTLQDLADALHYYKKEKNNKNSKNSSNFSNNEKFIRYCIKPVEAAIAHLPKIYALDTAVDSLCHGSNLSLPGISRLDSEINPHDLVAVVTLKGELIALGAARLTSEEMMVKEKGYAVKTFRVFMEPDIYPKIRR